MRGEIDGKSWGQEGEMWGGMEETECSGEVRNRKGIIVQAEEVE